MTHFYTKVQFNGQISDLSIQHHGRVIILLQKELINHEATEGYLTRNTRTQFLYKELGSLINNQDISRKKKKTTMKTRDSKNLGGR